MLKENCRVGMQVEFGRENGEKTLGRVVKMNPTKAKVEILEQRGRGRGSEVGSVWGVPYALMEPAGEATGSQAVVRPAVNQADEPIPYSVFQDAADQHILQAILCCYTKLSPENLSCDGELPVSQIRQRRAALERKLKGLFQAYGREVSEYAVSRWDEQRRQQQRQG
jgi:hypothetical protein